jgi:hypothetical protein
MSDGRAGVAYINQRRALNDQGAQLAAHDEVLQVHQRVLEGHARRLQEYARILSGGVVARLRWLLTGT